VRVEGGLGRHPRDLDLEQEERSCSYRGEAQLSPVDAQAPTANPKSLSK